jgi:preprotein translocase subunit SecE
MPSEDAREVKPRISPFQFIQQVRQEVAKVTWPSRRETLITTIMVFIMTAFAGLFFFLVDQAISFVVRLLMGLGS